MREDTKNMVSMAPTYDNFPKTSVPSISAFRMSNYSTSNAFNTGNNFNTQVYGSYENSQSNSNSPIDKNQTKR